MMKQNYYCLVAGCPDVTLDMAKPPISENQWREDMSVALSPADKRLVELIYLERDNRRFLDLLTGHDTEITAEDMTLTITTSEPVPALMNYLAEEHESSKLPVTLQEGQNMNILIGPENVNEALKDTSVVMASYDIGDNMRGVIGVVGPTRMDYAKVTARLSYFADSLTRMFGKGELPPGDGDGGGQDKE